ncbi:MAG: dimethylsulfonioproprionate lyase family protein [Rhizobiaceae bacterium]
MTPLHDFYIALAGALNGTLPIEAVGKQALLDHADEAFAEPEAATPLPQDVLDVIQADDAHPCCKLLASAPLNWAPPLTTDDPDYIEVSKRKVLVELIGPEGLVKRNTIRMGVYGISPGVEYGIRTHPAEELFVMLAGRADWLRGDDCYAEYGPGTRRHHSSMMQHATRTRDSAFMSIYIWTGDVSFENYVYSGVSRGACN